MTSEKMFDILPIVVEIYEELNIDGFRKTLPENTNSKDAGIKAFKYMLKNSSKVKQQVFEVVAVLADQTIEEVRAQNFFKTINTLKQLFESQEVQDFFN